LSLCAASHGPAVLVDGDRDEERGVQHRPPSRTFSYWASSQTYGYRTPARLRSRKGGEVGVELGSVIAWCSQGERQTFTEDHAVTLAAKGPDLHHVAGHSC
jgi:hypothetical protein